MNIDDLKLTQLYLNQRKVNEIGEWLDDNSIQNTIISVIHYDNQFYIVDGHTRCFVAFNAGITEIPIELYDIDPNSVELKLYIECMKWCEENDIHHISDLSSRIVDETSFKQLWINKCKAEMELLEDIEDINMAE
ncbi:hypothetical protein [Macrococcus capreoli]|uniref:hypothetical protein n=1 Tax=Macrococcus capreoli TaxID=2982690 RepID=UPI0021D5BC4C|nr:hypothetical protein [Macrococcus sp. TMW 2.2395]MCU7558476.1 hypothetical protein [Macrococcus sp. TMW 2.2395]